MYTKSITTGLLAAASLWSQSALVQLAPTQLAQLKLREPQRVSIAAQHLASQKALLQLPPDAGFTAGRRSLDAAGQLHVRFDQTFHGVKVTPAQIIVHLDRDDNVRGITGALLSGISLDVTPKTGEKEALEIVRNDYLRRQVDMRSTAELVVYVTRNSDGPNEGGIRSANLAWKTRVEADEETAMYYYVDAHAGTILRKASAEYSSSFSPADGTGDTKRYPGPVHFTTAWDDDPPNPLAAGFRLLDPTRGNNKVINMELKAGWSGLQYLYSHNEWGNGQDFEYETMDTWSPEGRGAGFEAALGMQRLWDMLKYVFNRNGLDDNGKGMTARVHARKKSNEPYADARWDGNYANFGDSTKASNTSILVVGHEFGHGLFQNILGSNDFDGEARGLNEGHGDIVGSLVSIYNDINHGQGNTLPVDAALALFKGRSVKPLGYSAEGETGLPYYVPHMGDREEHTQGCAYGHAFVFLAVGASPTVGDDRYSIYLPNGMVGIGVHKAAQIWYKATNEYMDDSPTFQEVRAAYINAALDLFGAGSLEVKAVQNAFYGINVQGGPNPYSGPAADTANPDANLSDPIVNEDEGTAFVSMSATDDVGVVKLELTLDGVSVVTVDGPGPKSWYGYVSLAGLGNATHTLRAIATDSAGKTNQEAKQFILTGVNHLIDNGTFENGGASWSESSAANYGSNASLAFLGSGYAQLGTPGSWIKQTVSIPSTATSARLTYRLRVEKFYSPIAENLLVEVLSAGGTVLDVLANYTAQTPIGDAVTNGYDFHSHSSLKDYAGQTIQIRFRTVAGLPGRFKLDNVSLVWSGPVSATTHVIHDDDEGSVEIEVNNLSNIQANQVKTVSLVINGANAGGWASPAYKIAYPSSAFLPNATHSVYAQIRNMANTVVGTTPEVHFSIHPGNNLLDNPGFENGTFDWSRTGGTQIGQNNLEAGINYAFLGNRFAYMQSDAAATQTLQQQVYLPGDADNITLGFRLRVDSPNQDVSDYLQVRLLDTNNNVIAALATFLGNHNTYSSANWMGYQKVKINITSHKGQMVRLQFRATHNATHPTTFYIDNVSVVPKTFGIAGN